MPSRTFSKSVVLMCSPHAGRVPLGQDKVKLYLNKHIIDGVDIPLTADLSKLKEFFRQLFTEQLGSAVVKEVRMARSHNLIVPNLPSNKLLNAVNLKNALSQSKYIYLLPSQALSLKDVSMKVEQLHGRIVKYTKDTTKYSPNKTPDYKESSNHQTDALPRHCLEQLSTALDEVHKRGYRIALLAAHQDSNNTDDIITMYRGDITLKTKLQLQVVFSDLISDMPDDTTSVEERPTFSSQEKISNSDNTGMRCESSISDITDTVITDKQPESPVEDITNCQPESVYHDAIEKELKNTSLPCHDRLVKTEPADYEYIVQRDSQPEQTGPVTQSVVCTEMPQCSVIRSESASNEIMDLKPTDIELHIVSKECDLQVHELSNHCSSGPQVTRVKTEPVELHPVVHNLAILSEQEQTTNRPSTPALESPSKKLRRSPQSHASSHIMISDSPRTHKQPMWSKDSNMDS